MGGLVSGGSNRYESASEEFREDQQPVTIVNGVNSLFARRRSRKLSVRGIEVSDVERVRIDHLAVPCANRHPFSDYRFNKKLGAGAFSTVYKCTSVFNDTQVVAIKEVRTSDLTKDQLLDLQTEMNILSQVHHKNIVNLNAVFILPDKIFMVMEYLRGGELLKAICKRTCYEERDAKRVMIQLADAVRYLHHRGVIHRDLKPENIILETKDFQSGIKIVDFGFAIVTDDIQPRTKKYVKGTPGYMAPEVITSGEYTTGCDIWSLGVILYIILSGTMPFDARNKESVVVRILALALSIAIC
jgi:serine/threonine protein kinase